MLTRFICSVFNHPHDHIRERNEQGHMGLRCAGCMTLLPNTFESIGVAVGNPNRKLASIVSIRAGRKPKVIDTLVS